MSKKCPECGEEIPKVRVPYYLDEALWGGWTCPKCGARLDAAGKLKKGMSKLEKPNPSKKQMRTIGSVILTICAFYLCIDLLLSLFHHGFGGLLCCGLPIFGVIIGFALFLISQE